MIEGEDTSFGVLLQSWRVNSGSQNCSVSDLDQLLTYP